MDTFSKFIGQILNWINHPIRLKFISRVCMANITYKNNVTSFTVMQKYIDDSITIADDMVDLAEMEIWQAKKEQLSSWIDGDGLVQDPMTDEDWKAAKVDRPVVIQESEVTTNEAVDSENELFEKNVVKTN